MYAKAHSFFLKTWWALPLVSGVLLVLTFNPFDLWPLGFVALAPLYWFVGGFGFSRKKIFWGGAICGSIFAFALSYYTVVQFHWLPETYLFVWIVRLLVVPVTLLGAGVWGLSLVLLRELRGRSALGNAALAAAIYTLSEFALSAIFGGYYLATLAYVATPLPALVSLAAVGGEHLLSFWIVLISGLAAEALSLRRVPWRAWGWAALATAVVWLPNYLYLHAPLPVERALRVVVLQNGTRDPAVFGTQRGGRFVWAEAQTLTEAGKSTPDLVVYPFSPVEGAMYRGIAPAFNQNVLAANESTFGEFVGTLLPASTTLLTWNNIYHDGRFYNEYELWQGGRVAAEYQKRVLFPFMDYTPLWAARLGLYSTPFDDTPGAPDNRLVLNGVPLGDLMCSELHDSALARAEAARAPLIVAVGSEAMFLDDTASAFSLRAAQLRAAENDVPVIRGNILGPSGVADRFGALVAHTAAGTRAQLEATVIITPSRRTLFNLIGEWPLAAVLGVGLAAAWYLRLKRTQN